MEQFDGLKVMKGEFGGFSSCFFLLRRISTESCVEKLSDGDDDERQSDGL